MLCLMFINVYFLYCILKYLNRNNKGVNVDDIKIKYNYIF